MGLIKTWVIGAGHIGRALAGLLQSSGQTQVNLWNRQGPLKTQYELTLPRQQYAVQLDGKLLPDPDIIFIATRAYDLPGVQQFLEQHLQRPTPVIVCCNGWVSDFLRRDLSSVIWRQGVVSFGVRQESGAWKLVGDPTVHFGALIASHAATAAEKQLQATSRYWHWDDSIVLRTRRKWFCNATLNSLCAVRRLKNNGQAWMFSADLKNLAHDIYQGATAKWLDWQDSEQALWSQLTTLIERTAANENSMARAWRCGEPIEHPYLAGLVAGKDMGPTLRRYDAMLSAWN